MGRSPVPSAPPMGQERLAVLEMDYRWLQDHGASWPVASPRIAAATSPLLTCHSFWNKPHSCIKKIVEMMKNVTRSVKNVPDNYVNGNGDGTLPVLI